MSKIPSTRFMDSPYRFLHLGYYKNIHVLFQICSFIIHIHPDFPLNQWVAFSLCSILFWYWHIDNGFRSQAYMKKESLEVTFFHMSVCIYSIKYISPYVSKFCKIDGTTHIIVSQSTGPKRTGSKPEVECEESIISGCLNPENFFCK